MLSSPFRSGTNQWRDCSTPKQLLAEWCESQSLPKPHYIGNTQVIIDQQTYTLSDFGKFKCTFPFVYFKPEKCTKTQQILYLVAVNSQISNFQIYLSAPFSTSFLFGDKLFQNGVLLFILTWERLSKDWHFTS